MNFPTLQSVGAKGIRAQQGEMAFTHCRAAETGTAQWWNAFASVSPDTCQAGVVGVQNCTESAPHGGEAYPNGLSSNTIGASGLPMVEPECSPTTDPRAMRVRTT